MTSVPDFAATADLPAIAALVQSAYRGESARRGWTHEADLIAGQRTDLAAIAAIHADPNQRLLVLRDAGAVIGSVVVEDRGHSTAYLGMLSVDPARQASGLGRTLIAAAEALARDIFHATRIEMTVIARRTELIAYYQRRGYRLTDEIRPFPYDDPTIGEPIARDLDFAVLEKRLVEG